MISLVDILLESLFRMTAVEHNQTGAHRTIIIQTFIPVNHVPIHMVHGSPTFLLQCLVIQAMEVVLVCIVENEIHILQNIVLVLRST